MNNMMNNFVNLCVEKTENRKEMYLYLYAAAENEREKCIMIEKSAEFNEKFSVSSTKHLI